MTTLYDDKYIKIVVHEDEKILAWKIKTFIPDEKFRKFLEKIYGFFSEFQCNKVLIDTRQMRVMPNNTQEWIDKDWMPRMVRGGLKMLANLMPTKRITTGTISVDEMSNVLRKKLKEIGIAIEWFYETEPAYKWLAPDSYQSLEMIAE